MSDWITITIDGQEIQAKNGELLTDAAARAGIDIPIFCSHPKLDPLGACRMCLVEQVTPRGNALITACTTPIRDGAVFLYESEKAVDARKGTMELILANHPLDCPICDKGGECPLQNQALEHGSGHSHFWEEKNHKAKAYPLSDLVLLDQERCILCWRCIRYMKEWEDKPQIGLFYRGGETVIDKFPEGELDAYTSGSIIDICPVGALTNRTARFSYRPWDTERTASICTQCGQGCNMTVDSRNKEVRRHVSRENMAVNDEWICDKGRYTTDLTKNPDRLQQPLARIDGKLQPVSWQEAVQRVVDGLKTIVNAHGAESVGAVGSAKISNEANYVLGKFMRAMVGTNNLDYREGAALLADPRGISSLEDVQNADLIVLMGSDPAEEMPVLANSIKRAAKRNGVPMIIIHPRRTELAQYASVFLNPTPAEEVALFDGLTRSTMQARMEANEEDIPDWLREKEEVEGVSSETLALAGQLIVQAERPFIVYGADYAWGYGARDIISAITNWVMAAGHEDRLGFLRNQANDQGAGDMGILPDYFPGRRSISDRKARLELESLWNTPLPTQSGLSYGGMIASARGRIKAMYIMGSDPIGEKPADAESLKSLQFLVVQDIFLTKTAQMADVVLPAATYFESDGTFTNTDRRVQRANQVIQPVGKSVADWLILMHIAVRYNPGAAALWKKPSTEAIFEEIVQVVPMYADMTWDSLGESGQQWDRDLVPVKRESHSYSGSSATPTDTRYPFRLVVSSLLWDGGTTFAATLEMAHLASRSARLHPKDAARLGLVEDDLVEILSRAGEIRLPLNIDDSIKQGTVFVPFSLPEAPVGALFDSQGPRTNVAVIKATS